MNFLARLTIWITVAATVGTGIAFCLVGIVTGADNDTLSRLTGRGALVGFVVSVIIQLIVNRPRK